MRPGATNVRAVQRPNQAGSIPTGARVGGSRIELGANPSSAGLCGYARIGVDRPLEQADQASRRYASARIGA